MGLSKGNSKLPTTTGIFNLPAVQTCSNCLECKEFCYALKAERMYPNVLPSRMSNWSDSFNQLFVNKTVLRIIKLNVNTIRIHESGDFFDQSYFLKWIEIARQLPGIQFYAYTKSIELDFSERPVNLRIIASVPHDDLDGLAVVLQKGEKAEKGYLTCGGDCKICSYCYRSKGFVKVAFPLH
jgi:hypothetical protein